MINDVRTEFLRYKTLAEGAINQVSDEALMATAADGSNSIAIICQHVAGNLKSRFTDFLTSDGEKPWRHRDSEFHASDTGRTTILEQWQEGWAVLLGTLDGLTDADLMRQVTIRHQPHTVGQALLRAVAHVSYHVGQIVFIAKADRGARWVSLSIPPGESEAHNRASARDEKR